MFTFTTTVPNCRWLHYERNNQESLKLDLMDTNNPGNYADKDSQTSQQIGMKTSIRKPKLMNTIKIDGQDLHPFPFLFHHLSRSRSWRQHAEQRSPDFPLPGQVLSLALGVPKMFPVQMVHINPPEYSGYGSWSPGWMWLEHLPMEASWWNARSTSTGTPENA